jgi:hypothetical protein
LTDSLSYVCSGWAIQNRIFVAVLFISGAVAALILYFLIVGQYQRGIDQLQRKYFRRHTYYFRLYRIYRILALVFFIALKLFFSLFGLFKL